MQRSSIVGYNSILVSNKKGDLSVGNVTDRKIVNGGQSNSNLSKVHPPEIGRLFTYEKTTRSKTIKKLYSI
jgi:hypothetical protein